jgi:hypothetical protein
MDVPSEQSPADIASQHGVTICGKLKRVAVSQLSCAFTPLKAFKETNAANVHKGIDTALLRIQCILGSRVESYGFVPGWLPSGARWLRCELRDPQTPAATPSEEPVDGPLDASQAHYMLVSRTRSKYG